MNIDTPLDKMFAKNKYNNDGDWIAALDCVLCDRRQVVDARECSTGPFGPKDILAVLASSEGMNDGDPWLALFLLNDGRYAYISAWCDYTGWG